MSTWKPAQNAADEHAKLKAQIVEQYAALEKKMAAMEAMYAWKTLKVKKSGSVTFAQGGAVQDAYVSPRYRKPRKVDPPTPEDVLWDE